MDEDYKQSKRAIHIGILDFTLFDDCPEFYASHMMMNVKNHHIFSDKFILNVLDLTQIELATDEDRLCELDRWAKLFRAKTWEDLRMIAEKNQKLAEQAQILTDLTEERNRAVTERDNALFERNQVISNQ